MVYAAGPLLAISAHYAGDVPTGVACASPLSDCGVNTGSSYKIYRSRFNVSVSCSRNEIKNSPEFPGSFYNVGAD